MLVAGALVFLDVRCVIIKEISFVLMGGGKSGTDGLLLQYELRLFSFQEQQGLLVVLFLSRPVGLV